MRLRDRLLILFALFAVLPLLAVGALGYYRSLRALRVLVESRTAVQASRMERVFHDRLDRLESDIALLSGNDETQRLLAAQSRRDSIASTAIRLTADKYVSELWRTIQYGYHRILIRDISGRNVFVLGDSQSVAVRGLASMVPSIVRPIVALGDGARLGEIELRPRVSELLRDVGLDDRFGERGSNVLFDRDQQRILDIGGGTTAETPSAATLAVFTGAARRATATLEYNVNGERRVASLANFESPPWTLAASASIDEFAFPFLQQRVVDLALIIAIVLAVTLGFFVLLRRATRSLDQLTVAAERLGLGDLDPDLPPAGPDEVGHLASAFRVMVGRIREMLAQVEAGRQTAVLGRFAVELAHEIRNPLTSVKLNLQSLERDAREGRIPAESGAAISMSLREVHRLDQALRTALRVGRPAVPARAYSIHAVLEEAVALLQSEAAARRVVITQDCSASSDLARGDPEAVRGVFVNVLLNAIQAAASGGNNKRPSGVVQVETSLVRRDAASQAMAVVIRDDGPGIPADLKDRVFHPFFTTKHGGTGLGLAVSLQTVQSLGGSIRIADAPARGAEVVITMPIDVNGGTG